MLATFVAFLLSPLLKYLTLSVVVGGGGILIYLLTPAWVPARFHNAAGIVGICALTGGGFYWWAFHAGEQHMAQRIAAKDAAALTLVKGALDKVDACNNGVDWNVENGTCNR